MTRHTDEVRADGRLAYPELTRPRPRTIELRPLVHPSGMPVDPEPRWINAYDLPNAVIRMERLTDGSYKAWCTWTSVSGHGDNQVSVSSLDLTATLRLLSTAISNRHGAPVTITIPDPDTTLVHPQFPAGSCHYCGARLAIGGRCGDLERCRQRRSALAGLPYKLHDRNDPVHGPDAGRRPTAIELAWAHCRPPRTFADVLKAFGRRLIGGDYHGPDADISDTDYVVFPNAGINLDVLFPDDPPAERPDLTGQADVAAELDHAMRAAVPQIDIDGGTVRIGAAGRIRWLGNPPLVANLDTMFPDTPDLEWTPVGLRDVPLTLSEYMADPPTRDTRTHFTDTFVPAPPFELNPEELMSELGAIMDLMAPVRLLRDLCSGEDEHRRDVFDSFVRDLATRVAEIAAALQDGVG